MNGFFNVDKPAGWTSFDVVAALRRPLGEKRLGHAGTLDPLATGVLPLAAGYATRLLSYLADSDKEYLATVELGRTTDTYDAAGEETSRGDWALVDPNDVAVQLDSFRGEIQQTPPAYSAVKVAGERAYKRVRRGESVALAPRQVTIHELELLGLDLPRIHLRVICSRGTYLRSLAHDLGQALGVGGFLAELRRSRVGPFGESDSVGLDELRAAAAIGAGSSFIRAPDMVLRHLDAAILSPATTSDLRQGRSVRLYPGSPPGWGRRLPLGRQSRAYTAEGTLIGLLEYAAPPAVWKPVKIFTNA